MPVFLRTHDTRMLATACMLPFLIVTQAIAAAPESTFPSQIDALIEARLKDFSTHASPICTDAEFLRRVTLDLTASIPTAAKTRAFLKDTAPSQEKRSRVVTELLASPQHATRMQYLLDWLLMERRSSENVASAQWQKYLRASAVANKPWDELTREILADDGGNAKTRARARFYLDREFDLTVVTRDVSRIFLGVDLECAQCHDHPAVTAYKQQHYHGIKAFLDRSFLFTDSKSKQKSLGEKAEGDVTFTSAFDETKGKTAPRILELPELVDPKDTLKQYITKPAKNVRSVPRYSRRRQLGEAMTVAENQDFRLNIANRLWAVMMGRGLVEPLDLRHAANPPSHPELLSLLGDALHQHKYDMRWFLGQLAHTRAYQRSSVTRPDSATVANRHYAVGLLKPLGPEQYAWATMEATGFLEKVRIDARASLAAAAKKAAAKKGSKKKAPKAKTAATPPSPPTLADIEAAVRKTVAPHVKTFVTQFAAQGGQKTTFSATAPQALFLTNGALLREWLKPAGANLLARVSKLDDSQAVAEELYIRILNRLPTESEQKEVAIYMELPGKRVDVLGELAWALLLSAEFRFNH